MYYAKANILMFRCVSDGSGKRVTGLRVLLPAVDGLGQNIIRYCFPPGDRGFGIRRKCMICHFVLIVRKITIRPEQVVYFTGGLEKKIKNLTS